MTRSSRYVRPATPPTGLWLQPRDRAVLGATFHHRYVRSDHLQALCFPGVSIRTTQARLRKLWEHQLLERYYIPFILDGVHPTPPRANQPIYTLGRSGAAVVAEERGLALDAVPHGFSDGGAHLTTLEHRLVVADFLVAVTVACRERQDVVLAEAVNEAPLWTALSDQIPPGPGRAGTIVPDAAVTLSDGRGQRTTFYVEVVRADVKGGNSRLLGKLTRYVELHHAGFFRRVYRHEHLRAVVILTTSLERANNFRELAGGLTHGRRLFWFGAYEERDADGRAQSTLTPGTILSSRWQTIEGEAISFIPQSATPPLAVGVYPPLSP